MESTDFDRFSIYGFSIEYPKICRVEFNPKSKRDEGDVAFHFPDKGKIFVSWGNLEKAEKSFRTVEEHAEHSLNAVKKGGNVRGFQRIIQDSLNVNSHKGSYNLVKLDEITVGFFTGKKTVKREAHSIHLHCTPSSRYFVIYGAVSEGESAAYKKTLMAMIDSFRCH